MNNKALGNKFENELDEILGKRMFWVHRLTANASGQPADFIATKNNKPYLIDAKVCSNDKFDTRRIEPNQHTAMSWWYIVNHEYPVFIFKTTKGIFVADYYTLSEKQGWVDATQYKPLEVWLNEIEN